jgi:poly(hydroxyalkanoate) depolymerase family esterase
MSRFRTLVALTITVLALTAAAAQAYTIPGTYVTGAYTNFYGARAYEVYIPPSYHAGTAVPLVVALHGCSELADQFRQLTQFDRLASARNFIVVFPEQAGYANSAECWNWEEWVNQSRGAGEPSLIAGITSWVKSHYTIDAKRVYTTGISAGGAMADIMGATYPDVYAAIGVHSGCEYNGYVCIASQGPDPVTSGHQAYTAMGSFKRRLPVIVFQGTSDPFVPPINGDQVIRQWQVTNDYIDDGSFNGSISSSPATTTPGAVPGGRTYTVRRYNDHAGAELEQYWTVDGMVHAWSGGCSCELFSDPAGPDATTAMYDFFMAHPKP